MSFDTSSRDQGFQTKAVVKWFNLTKGFGFVAPADGSADAFLHSSVVNSMGMQSIAEGTELLCCINDGPKGRQVANIVEVLGTGALPPQSASYSRPMQTASGPEEEMYGTVKWFKPDKGFGFVTPDDGGRDVFVHRSILLRAGIEHLDSGEKVRMKIVTASKGREASSIEIIR